MGAEMSSFPCLVRFVSGYSQVRYRLCDRLMDWYLCRGLSPGEADRLVGALRTHRDRAMLLAGLRRCEVLGLRFADVEIADRRLAVVEGKGPAITGSCRRRTGSLTRSAPTCMTSGPRRRVRTGCSWC
jgi:integrase